MHHHHHHHSPRPQRVVVGDAAQAIRGAVDVEQLGAADEEPLQLGLVPFLGHLLDGGHHVGIQLGQHVGDDLASSLGVHWALAQPMSAAR